MEAERVDELTEPRLSWMLLKEAPASLVRLWRSAGAEHLKERERAGKGQLLFTEGLTHLDEKLERGLVLWLSREEHGEALERLVKERISRIELRVRPELRALLRAELKRAQSLKLRERLLIARGVIVDLLPEVDGGAPVPLLFKELRALIPGGARAILMS